MTSSQNFKHRIFLKYAVVEIIGTIIDVGSLYFLVEFLHFHLLVAAAISFILAIINNFICNKYWTFENKSSNVRKQFIKFLIVAIIGLVWTEVLMILFVYALKIWYILSKLMTSMIVLVWNFLTNKNWTFRDRIFSAQNREKYDYDISIIVPAFNEENRVGKTVRSIAHYFSTKKLKWEIIVVDDGSQDNTTGVVEELKRKIDDLKIIRYSPNYGKGYAVKKGIEASHGEYILFTDADGSTPIEEFEKFHPLLYNNEIVIGSRYSAGSNIFIKQPFYRIALGRLGNMLIQFFLLDGVHDTQCGFKGMQHHAAQEIFTRMKINRFGFDIEMISIARLLNYSINEMPVSWYNSSESRVRPIRDALRTLGDLIYIKLNLMSGRYN